MDVHRRNAADLSVAVATEFPNPDAGSTMAWYIREVGDAAIDVLLSNAIIFANMDDDLAFQVNLSEDDDVERIVLVFERIRTHLKVDDIRLYKLVGDLWITRVDQQRAEAARLA